MASLAVSLICSAVVVIIYTLFAHFIDIKKFKVLHESGIAIIFGAAFSAILKFGAGVEVLFSPDGFFYAILPPLIFCAGYTLKRKNFTRNIVYIMMLGILGTIFAMIVNGLLISHYNTSLIHEDERKIYGYEELLLSAVLCSTDTIAALTIVREKDFPVLNAVLFGEGAVNDAVSILIFRAVEDMVDDVTKSYEITGTYR